MFALKRLQHTAGVLWWLLAETVIALPTVTAAFLLTTYSATFQDVAAPIWSDEVFYWHQAASFGRVGFDSGYYTLHEKTASALFAHYYVWGTAPPIIYGLPARVLGWELYSMPIYNLAFLSAGLAVYIWSVKPNISSLLLLAATVVTYPPFVTHYNIAMLPLMELGVSLGLAGGILNYLRAPARWKLIALLAAVIIAGFIRVYWVLLVLPLLLASLERWTPRSIVPMLGGGIVLIAAVWGAFLYTSAPYPNLVNQILTASSVEDALQAWMLHVSSNVSSLTQGHPLELNQRAQLAFLVLFATAALGWQLWRARRTTGLAQTLRRAPTYALLIGLYLLISTLAIAVFIYDVFDWRGFRLLAPVMLFATALLIGVRWWGAVVVFVLMSAALMPNTLETNRLWLSEKLHYREQAADFSTWHEQLKAAAPYDAQAASPWCNTVYFPVGYLMNMPLLVSAFDRGIGLSFWFDLAPPFNIKSRWLLLTDDFAAEHRDQLRVERLLTVPNGALYRNLDSPCDGLQPSPTDDS